MITFDSPKEKAFLKSLWEKERMLVLSISSFSLNDLSHLMEELYYVSHNEILVYKSMDECNTILGAYTKSSIKRRVLGHTH